MNLASNLASGRHAFRFELGESPGCAIGEVRLEVITRGDRGRLLAVQTIRVGPGQAVSLPFRLRPLDAAFGTVAVAAEGLTGCAVLEDVRWSEAAARPVWGPPRRLVGGSAAP